jgi:hypothetical protein
MEQTIEVLGTASVQWAGVDFGGSIAAAATAIGIPVSAAAIGSAVIGVVGATVIALRVKDYRLAVGACLILAVLASPLSWVHYDVLIIPAVFLVLFANDVSARGRILGSVTLAGWLLGKIADSMYVDLTLRSFLLLAVLWTAGQASLRPMHDPKETRKRRGRREASVVGSVPPAALRSGVPLSHIDTARAMAPAATRWTIATFAGRRRQGQETWVEPAS